MPTPPWSVAQLLERRENAVVVPPDAFSLVSEPGRTSTVTFLTNGWYIELNMSGDKRQLTEAELTTIAQLIASRV